MVEAQKPSIMSRLKDRYGIQFPPAIRNLSIPGLIFLTDDVNRLLTLPKVAVATNDISAGSGQTTYFTVPTGKRWRLKALQKDVTTGTTTWRIEDRDSVGFEIFSGTAETVFENLDIPMGEGWFIEVDNTGNGADTARAARIVYEEEDAY